MVDERRREQARFNNESQVVILSDNHYRPTSPYTHYQKTTIQCTNGTVKHVVAYMSVLVRCVYVDGDIMIVTT